MKMNVEQYIVPLDGTRGVLTISKEKPQIQNESQCQLDNTNMSYYGTFHIPTATVPPAKLMLKRINELMRIVEIHQQQLPDSPSFVAQFAVLVSSTTGVNVIAKDYMLIYDLLHWDDVNMCTKTYTERVELLHKHLPQMHLLQDQNISLIVRNPVLVTEQTYNNLTENIQAPIALYDAVETKFQTMASNKLMPKQKTRNVLVCGQIDIIRANHKDMAVKYTDYNELKKIPVRFRRSLWEEAIGKPVIPEDETPNDEHKILEKYNHCLTKVYNQRKTYQPNQIIETNGVEKLPIINNIPDTVYLLAAPINDNNQMYIFGYTQLSEKLSKDMIIETENEDCFNVFTKEQLGKMFINSLENLDGSTEMQNITVLTKTLKTIPFNVTMEIKDIDKFYSCFQFNECTSLRVKNFVTTTNYHLLFQQNNVDKIPIHRIIKSNLNCKDATKYEMLNMLLKRAKYEYIQTFIRHQDMDTSKLTATSHTTLLKFIDGVKYLINLLTNVQDDTPNATDEVLCTYNSNLVKHISDLNSQLQQITSHQQQQPAMQANEIKRSTKRKREHTTSTTTNNKKQNVSA